MSETHSAQYSFIDIFSKKIIVGNDEYVQLKKIVIPKIQRDYAQGRDDDDAKRVRSRFLEALKSAICEKPITLDFIYGDIDENGVMTPLDGQQRLTTLFLLHYYIAKKENISADEYSFLQIFSYETRHSARDFCDFLVNDFEPAFSKSIKEEIENHADFPLAWKKDATVDSMIRMLQSIEDAFCDVENAWQSLKNGAVTFYFLALENMGLTDELYIKMNSRGKPLTRFEHFKAELERELLKIDKDSADRIASKIDRQWTDMLWRYRGEDNIIDDEFLHYFYFICAVICYENDGTMLDKELDEFELLEEFFSANSMNVRKNIETLEAYFDCWCKNNLGDYDSPGAFFEAFISKKHTENKIKIDERYEIDIFEDCLKNNYDDGARNRSFPLGRIILLYAFIAYLRNKNDITVEQFARRIRIINNLINNSSDEISERSGRNRIPAILKQTEYIIKNGTVNREIQNSFNLFQLDEEAKKAEWTKANPDMSEMLFALEDHPILDGRISVIGLQNIDNAYDKFEKLFECDYDNIDCALMAIGFYGKGDGNYWRYQVGSGSKNHNDAWKSLFSRSSVGDNTGKAVETLLLKCETLTDEELLEIKNSYIAECEEKQLFEWRYYYVKYPVFRPGSYGKIWSNDLEKRPYEMFILQTRRNVSENTYNPYLKEIDGENLRSYGRYIFADDAWYRCDNDAYVRCHDDENNNEVDDEKIIIAQNEDGIDTENRIEKFRKYYNSRHIK